MSIRVFLLLDECNIITHNLHMGKAIKEIKWEKIFAIWESKGIIKIIIEYERLSE